jgi:hypothetical protein
MKDFEELKKNIIKQAITNDACLEELERAKNSENWDELKQVIADNIWWCIDNVIELPDDHYKNDEREFTVVNGKLEGEFKDWFDNGQLYEYFFFKNGEKHGEYKSWHVNGLLYKHYFYKDGELDGEIKMWYSNGKLEEHHIYKEDEPIETIVG